MPPPAPPREPGSDMVVDKLRAFDDWITWQFKTRRALHSRGLGHLLTQQNPDDLDYLGAASQRAEDEESGVRFLAESVSAEILAKAAAGGWKPEEATVLSTLHALQMLANDEAQRRREKGEESAATHKAMAGLTRIDLSANAKTVLEYILEAKQCHDGLLVRYGAGAGTVEALLDQLFATSVLEGIRTAQPNWYSEWKYEMADGSNASVAATRASATEWLLGKARAAAAARTPVTSSSPAETASSTGSLARTEADKVPRGPKDCGQRKHCNYCTENHPYSSPHAEEKCWFENPRYAPPRWLERYQNECDALRERRRCLGVRRGRSSSPLSRRVQSGRGGYVSGRPRSRGRSIGIRR